jgi:energy-converting hydrogenase Eha subunit B
MTKQEHLGLYGWLREIKNALEKAKVCPDSAWARVLMAEAAKNLEFLGGNLTGGTIRLEGGEEVSTGDFLAVMAKVLVEDHEGVHLATLIRVLGDMLASHEKHLAKLPDIN